MRMRSFTTCLLLAAFTACSTVDDGNHEHVGEHHGALSATPCVDPPPAGTADLSAPEDDAAEDDVSPLVDEVRALARRGASIETASLPRATALRVRVDVDADAIRQTREGAYASLALDDVRVLVVNDRSPARLPERGDLVLHVGARALLGLSLIASYTPAAGSFVLGVAVADDGTGAGPGVPVGPGSIALEGGCIPDAFAGLFDDMPEDMPPVKLPPMTGDCSGEQCVEIRRSWIRGHIELFWAHLMIEYVATLGDAQRSFVWSRPGRDALGDLTSSRTAPSYWFGGYDGGRFDKIREVVNDLWNVYRSGKTGGITLHHHCPVDADVGNVCFTHDDVPAHHWLKHRIEYCDLFFTEDEWTQTWVSVHEPIHHLWVDGVMVSDTHTHWHGASCLSSPKTEGIYGDAEAHELASYVNSNDSSCNHRDLATRTVDSYARMIVWFGGSILDGPMVQWPAWGDPTPKPPGCDPAELGTEGCECATTFGYGDYSSPDGDYAIDKVCYDNDGEMTCATTKFSASDTVGICTRCGVDQRAAGCACEQDDDCALGLFCYGADTWNGYGTGRCYDESPPSWVCLADCQTLFNDDLAYCWHDRPAAARCLDSFCDPWVELDCMAQGMVCREGACVVECTSNADCQGLGYPAAFECISNACQRPDLF